MRALLEVARLDAGVCLLVGDLGYSVVEPFAQEFGHRFVNVGVAEQNMIGLATGLALSGKKVFVYSIANFPTLRCLEQIRNDVCYHSANVKLVAVGGGLSYGALGVTHHGTEDLAVMRSLPNMVVLAPGDPVEAAQATRAAAAWDGPCYLRLGKAGEPVVHHGEPEFQIGRALRLREGAAVALVSTGGMLPAVMEAAGLLSAAGVEARVLSMHTLKPLDRDALLAAAKETEGVVTVEEHSILGGLGGAVAEALLEAGVAPGFFRRIGIPDRFFSAIGSQEYLRGVSGLTAAAIADTVRVARRVAGG